MYLSHLSAASSGPARFARAASRLLSEHAAYLEYAHRAESYQRLKVASPNFVERQSASALRAEHINCNPAAGGVRPPVGA